MKTVLTLLAGLVLAPLAHAQHDHAHAAHATPPAATVPATRHATDVTLRGHMADLRAAVATLGHAEYGHLDAAQTAALAAQVEEHVKATIADCKLEPQADAALHTILVPLLQGAAALKLDPRNHAAIAPMREAMARYAREFDDPDAD